MGAPYTVPTRLEQPSNDGRERLGRILHQAFPLSECRSFAGLMRAIDADEKAPGGERKPVLMQLD